MAPTPATARKRKAADEPSSTTTPTSSKSSSKPSSSTVKKKAKKLSALEEGRLKAKQYKEEQEAKRRAKKEAAAAAAAAVVASSPEVIASSSHSQKSTSKITSTRKKRGTSKSTPSATTPAASRRKTESVDDGSTRSSTRLRRKAKSTHAPEPEHEPEPKPEPLPEASPSSGQVGLQNGASHPATPKTPARQRSQEESPSLQGMLNLTAAKKSKKELLREAQERAKAYTHSQRKSARAAKRAKEAIAAVSPAAAQSPIVQSNHERKEKTSETPEPQADESAENEQPSEGAVKEKPSLPLAQPQPVAVSSRVDASEDVTMEDFSASAPQGPSVITVQTRIAIPSTGGGGLGSASGEPKIQTTTVRLTPVTDTSPKAADDNKRINHVPPVPRRVPAAHSSKPVAAPAPVPATVTVPIPPSAPPILKKTPTPLAASPEKAKVAGYVVPAPERVPSPPIISPPDETTNVDATKEPMTQPLSSPVPEPQVHQEKVQYQKQEIIPLDDSDDHEEDPLSSALAISRVLIGEEATFGHSRNQKDSSAPSCSRQDPVDTVKEDSEQKAQDQIDNSRESSRLVGNEVLHPLAEENEERYGSVGGLIQRVQTNLYAACNVCETMMKLFVLLSFVAVMFYTWYVVYCNVSQNWSKTIDASAPSSGRLMGKLKQRKRDVVPCYLDSSLLEPKNNSNEGDEKGQVHCSSKQPQKPCPSKGICRNGQWIQCIPSDLFEKDEVEGVCTLTKSAISTLDATKEQLLAWTADCMCNSRSTAAQLVTMEHVEIHHGDGKDETPSMTHWFALEDVSKAILGLDREVGLSKSEGGSDETGQETEDTVKKVRNMVEYLMTIVAFSAADDSPLQLSERLDLISLTPTGALKVRLPLLCSLKIWTWFFVTVIFALFIDALMLSGRTFLSKPLESLGVLMVCFSGYKIYDIRKTRALVREVAQQAKEISYEKLVTEANEGQNVYPVLHLREDVGQTLYPRSMRQRHEFFASKVWPRVVAEMRRDPRIQKSEQSVGGLPLECWAWLGNKGSTTPASRRRTRNTGSQQ